MAIMEEQARTVLRHIGLDVAPGHELRVVRLAFEEVGVEFHGVTDAAKLDDETWGRVARAARLHDEYPGREKWLNTRDEKMRRRHAYLGKKITDLEHQLSRAKEDRAAIERSLASRGLTQPTASA